MPACLQRGALQPFDFSLKPLLIKSTISLDLLLPLSHVARSTGLLCALKGRKLGSCRAHLTLFYSH